MSSWICLRWVSGSVSGSMFGSVSGCVYGYDLDWYMDDSMGAYLDTPWMDVYMCIWTVVWICLGGVSS